MRRDYSPTDLPRAKGSNTWSATRRALVIASSGLAVVVLTPFVFFPEIMGDVGVMHASPLRNGAAAFALSLGTVAVLGGLGALGWQFLKRGKSDADGLT